MLKWNITWFPYYCLPDEPTPDVVGCRARILKHSVNDNQSYIPDRIDRHSNSNSELSNQTTFEFARFEKLKFTAARRKKDSKTITVSGVNHLIIRWNNPTNCTFFEELKQNWKKIDFLIESKRNKWFKMWARKREKFNAVIV